jgi:hypothetical protein
MAGREGFEPSNARSKAWCLASLATAQQWNTLFSAVNSCKPKLIDQPTSLKPEA